MTVAGYTPHRLAARRALVQRFARWIQDRHVAVAALRADHVAAFVAAWSRGRETQKHERATLRRFVAYLRRRGVLATPPIPTAPLDALADDYVVCLRTDRGLADNSIAIYGPCARAVLAHCVATGGVRALETIDAEVIRTFLVARVAGRSSESARLLSVGLRAFLRFMVLRGVVTRDLSGAVPRVRTYQQASLPVVLSPEEVKRALATADRSTPRGRRDYAVLLLLARPGAPRQRGHGARARRHPLAGCGDRRARQGAPARSRATAHGHRRRAYTVRPRRSRREAVAASPTPPHPSARGAVTPVITSCGSPSSGPVSARTRDASRTCSATVWRSG